MREKNGLYFTVVILSGSYGVLHVGDKKKKTIERNERLSHGWLHKAIS